MNCRFTREQLPARSATALQAGAVVGGLDRIRLIVVLLPASPNGPGGICLKKSSGLDRMGARPRSIGRTGHLSSAVEHIFRKDGVQGSNP